MPVEQDFTVQKVLVDKYPLTVSFALSESDLADAAKLQVNLLPFYKGGAVLQFRRFLANIHQKNRETVTLYKYPSTPWEFYKEKYAPQWFLKRWPVDYTEQEVLVHRETNHMCPHLELHDEHPHLAWLYGSSKGSFQ